MTNRRPITPTRIIPAGAPLPDRGPLPGEAPPWWETPTTPPAPPAQPPVVPPAPPAPEPPPLLAPQVHVHVVMPYEPPPEPTRWERLWAWVSSIGRPWQICAALTLAVAPIPGTGYSAATTWAYGTNLMREEWGAGSGYAFALVPLFWVCARTARHGGTLLCLWGIVVALGGVLGAINPYDVVTIVTGVHQS